MPNVSVNITKKQVELIDRLVAEGCEFSRSEVLRNALRDYLRDKFNKAIYNRQQVLVGLLKNEGNYKIGDDLGL